MKLKLNNNQIALRIAYHNYSQDCLTSEIIEIPLSYKEWKEKTNKDEITKFLKRDTD